MNKTFTTIFLLLKQPLENSLEENISNRVIQNPYFFEIYLKMKPFLFSVVLIRFFFHLPPSYSTRVYSRGQKRIINDPVF